MDRKNLEETYHIINSDYITLFLCACSVMTAPWTVARQAPLPMGFSRQEYWRGLPFPPLGDLPDPRIPPESPALVGGFFTTEPPVKPYLTLGSRISGEGI